MLPPCGLNRPEQRTGQAGGLLVIPGASSLPHQPPGNYPNYQLFTDQIRLLYLFHIYSRLGQRFWGGKAKGVSLHLVKACSYTLKHTHPLASMQRKSEDQCFGFSSTPIHRVTLGKSLHFAGPPMSPSATQGSRSFFLSLLQGHRKDH